MSATELQLKLQPCLFDDHPAWWNLDSWTARVEPRAGYACQILVKAASRHRPAPSGGYWPTAG